MKKRREAIRNDLLTFMVSKLMENLSLADFPYVRACLKKYFSSAVRHNCRTSKAPDVGIWKETFDGFINVSRET